MSKEDILGQISGEDWIKKGGLDVPDDIFSALESPFDWFDELKPISFSRGNLPTIENILSYFSESEISNIVKSSSIEMLRTSYGINKCFNSKVYSNLAAKGDQLAASLKLKTRDLQIYQAAIQANNLFLNVGLLNKQVSSSSYDGQMGEVSIYQKVKAAEINNKDWLHSLAEKIQEKAVQILEPLLDQLQERKDSIPEEVIRGIQIVREKVLDEFAKFYIDLEKSLLKIKNDFAEGIRALKKKALDPFLADMRELRKKVLNPAIKDFRKLINKLNKLLAIIKDEKYKNDSVGGYTISSSFSPSAIVPVASPSVIDVIGVVNAIASGLLQTFILKGVAIPAQLAEAVTKTVTSLVLKGLNASGAEAVRYIAGGVLRGAKDLLPAVFNNTGMFAGAWSFLTSCAPYIIAAAVIIIITIKLSQKADIGNWITVLAVGNNNQEPDTVFARLLGDAQEKLKDLGKIKEDLIQETGKQYANIYAFSFDGDARKLCIDMSLAVPIPMKDEIANTLWTEFSTNFDFLSKE
ncbi:hypothetical protein [Nostoc sp. NZL]|uniref:hypothetical protein n=1 Tax=Nostoc sp. NZL TaxID=2650612 RepID=UPI0018C67548|nr:hypothetical protein [Nostoc sp. NZL]MBG1242599.1 hypothetical protein [Nostoc sp. NZL]MBG1243065.1 hypothetical protein [Nostoc sp. NZL]